jgi:glycosyltransferase involved in cell wall biosynthesis
MGSSPPRISVALCTFNGERFLSQQLQSLLHQSCLPDELIVFDDVSTDRTINILETFAGTASFPVRIHRNEKTIGPAQNFGQAIAACSGEIISFCDQDDVWESNKIERTLSAFDRNPQLAFVFSDAEICDQNCQPLGYPLWTSVGFTGRLRTQFDSGNGFDVLLRQNIVTGATLSFASRFGSMVLPIGHGWMHDGWIALLLSAVAAGEAISKPLIRYRQHADQSIGAARRSLYQQYLNAKKMDTDVFDEQANQFEAVLARLQEQTDFEVPTVLIQKLQEKIKHCRRRSSIRQREISRLLPVMGELLAGRYQKFSLGWKSFAQDLFL